MEITEAAPNLTDEQTGSAGATRDKRGHGEKITARLLLKMLEDQGYRCALTGRELTPKTAALDHKIPLCRGGSNTIDNVQIVHKEANQSKHALAHDDFVALCREVVRHVG